MTSLVLIASTPIASNIILVDTPTLLLNRDRLKETGNNAQLLQDKHSATYNNKLLGTVERINKKECPISSTKLFQDEQVYKQKNSSITEPNILEEKKDEVFETIIKNCPKPQPEKSYDEILRSLYMGTENKKFQEEINSSCYVQENLKTNKQNIFKPLENQTKQANSIIDEAIEKREEKEAELDEISSILNRETESNIQNNEFNLRGREEEINNSCYVQENLKINKQKNFYLLENQTKLDNNIIDEETKKREEKEEELDEISSILNRETENHIQNNENNLRKREINNSCGIIQPPENSIAGYRENRISGPEQFFSSIYKPKTVKDTIKRKKISDECNLNCENSTKKQAVYPSSSSIAPEYYLPETPPSSVKTTLLKTKKDFCSCKNKKQKIIPESEIKESFYVFKVMKETTEDVNNPNILEIKYKNFLKMFNLSERRIQRELKVLKLLCTSHTVDKNAIENLKLLAGKRIVFPRQFLFILAFGCPYENFLLFFMFFKNGLDSSCYCVRKRFLDALNSRIISNEENLICALLYSEKNMFLIFHDLPEGIMCGVFEGLKEEIKFELADPTLYFRIKRTKDPNSSIRYNELLKELKTGRVDLLKNIFFIFTNLIDPATANRILLCLNIDGLKELFAFVRLYSREYSEKFDAFQKLHQDNIRNLIFKIGGRIRKLAKKQHGFK